MEFETHTLKHTSHSHGALRSLLSLSRSPPPLVWPPPLFLSPPRLSPHRRSSVAADPPLPPHLCRSSSLPHRCCFLSLTAAPPSPPTSLTVAAHCLD
ncbi:hypothetical protein LOK49_LG01G02044 [Camellia lanceoleosa]|uniref:Uncharacterized protein n=1 Tax=Camellia lanceoleosa TaxID=1840588 RepID=A0ACC0IXN5_9ERIC|nr:hypothetical protein LOK49_LG01G02044 [Camellia lanceoleosa]